MCKKFSFNEIEDAILLLKKYSNEMLDNINHVKRLADKLPVL